MSTSTTTTLVYLADLAYGEQDPHPPETATSWQTWQAAGGITVEGDPDWGRIGVGVGSEVSGPVQDFQTVSTRRFKLLENKYGAGAGLGQISIRGSGNSFNWNDALPAWEIYAGPIVRTWRYVQAKLGA